MSGEQSGMSGEESGVNGEKSGVNGEKSGPKSFAEAVARFIDRHGLIGPHQHVVVGVSGGADSVALLAVLRELAARPSRAYRLTAAHLNHCLRDGAQADAAFVAELADRWHIHCVVGRRDVAAEARRSGRGIEQAARMLRYEFLCESARGLGASRVAVGHHADDNVETILYRIVRGTHVRGLGGMRPARPMEGPGLTLIRPLLSVRREEIAAFCQRADLTWRTDPTNADTAYRRNFIRHELLPLLRSRLNPRADEALLRLAAAAGDLEAFVGKLAAAALKRCVRQVAGPPRQAAVLDAAILAQEPAVIRAYVLRLTLENLGVPMGSFGAERFAELVEVPEAGGPAANALPGGFVARCEAGEIIIEPAGENAGRRGRLGAARGADAIVALARAGSTGLPDGRRIVCTLEPFDPEAFEAHCRNRKLASSPAPAEMLDADRLRGGLLCRPRCDGDAFVPLGAPGRQSVSDFLTNQKLPRRVRNRVRCICDDLGIVYLAPLRLDDRVKITDATERVLRVAVIG